MSVFHVRRRVTIPFLVINLAQLQINRVKIDGKLNYGEVMNFRALETLIAILNLRSFSKVAELRNMTLSAVSMQMKSLEQELGVSLFDRQSRPPRLTPLGRQIAEKAKAILKERDALAAICQSPEQLQGTFLIGFIPTASVRILPTFLAASQSQSPYAQFQVSTGVSEDLTVNVEEGRIDAAIVTQVDMPSSNLKWDKITTEEMVLVAPSSQPHETEDQLARSLPFIQFRPTTGIGRIISAVMSERVNQPARRLIMDSIEGSIDCVKLGLGYTILPKPDVLRYFDDQLMLIQDHDYLPSRDMVLVTRNDDASILWSDRLAELLRQAAGVDAD